MTKINEVIPAMPDAPDSTTDTKTEFNVKADAFVVAWTPHTTSINTWATEANAVATEINSIVASLPVGTIDDVNIGDTKVFSNLKTEATYVSKAGDTMTGTLNVPVIANAGKTLKVEELSTLAGNGQTWQALSIGFDVEYTNTSDKPIVINLSITGASNSSAFVTATIGGYYLGVGSMCGVYSTGASSGNVIIPAGDTYEFTQTGIVNSYFRVLKD